MVVVWIETFYVLMLMCFEDWNHCVCIKFSALLGIPRFGFVSPIAQLHSRYIYTGRVVCFSLPHQHTPKITTIMTAQKSSTFRRYAELEPPENVWQLSYVWIVGSVNTIQIRFKTRTIDFEPKTPEGEHIIQQTFCVTAFDRKIMISHEMQNVASAELVNQLMLGWCQICYNGTHVVPSLLITIPHFYGMRSNR